MENKSSVDILYGSLVSDYRATGVATEEDEITKIGAGAKDMQSFEQDLTDIEGNEDKKAGASFDSIYSPYSTYFSAVSGLPHFEEPTHKTDPNSLTLNPFNPNNSLSLAYAPTGSKLYQASLGNSGAPSAGELQFSEVDPDPSGIGKERGDMRRANRTWLDAESEGWLEFGHNIKTAVNGTGNRYNTDFDYQFTESSGYDVEVTNIRGVGHRSPMVLTGWGFDIEGKPVPNANTIDPGFMFASGAFKDPSIWKSGPVDLRWDNDRKVWSPPLTKIALVKTTNIYNPPYFSYEVDRSDSRSQFTRFGPDGGLKTFDKDAAIHDPENIAYTANTDNVGGYEQLNYGGIEYPYYEAFIIRETKDDTSNNPYYNIWTDDCNDCGHITNSGCGTQHGSPSKDKKILIENPLRQSLEVGDLAFTVKTGKKQKVNTGTFTGGNGTGASGNIQVDVSGNATTNITAAGAGYSLGGIGIVTGICANISLVFGTASTGLSAINLSGNEGFRPGTYNLDIIPNDANADTEELDIHWILQAEFKSQQIVTHVECEGGLLQSCSMKIQTQGFKTCEWCGEDTTFINAF